MSTEGTAVSMDWQHAFETLAGQVQALQLAAEISCHWAGGHHDRATLPAQFVATSLMYALGVSRHQGEVHEK